MQRLEYHVTVRSDEQVYGELRAGSQITRSGPEPLAPQPTLPAYIAEILSRGEEQSRDILQHIGSDLYNMLFTGAVKSHFEHKAWDRVDEQQEYDRLALSLALETGLRPEIASLPWEFLYCERGHTFLATDPRVAFSREAVDLTFPAPEPLPPDEPLKVMLIHSSPPKLPPVALTRVQNILTELSEAEDRLARPLILAEPKPEAIEEALAEYRPHILHLLAHGHFEERSTQVALVDSAGSGEHWYNTRSLVDLFQRLGRDDLPRVLILQACEIGQPSQISLFNPGGAAVFQPSIPAVIAMYYTITNAVGWDFSEQFYRSLVVDKDDLDAAVQQGRRTLCRAGDQSPDTHANRNFGGLMLWLKPGAHRLYAEQASGEVLVRIIAPGGQRFETAVPGETLVHHLLQAFLAHWPRPAGSEPQRYSLRRGGPDGSRLNPADSLAEAGFGREATLYLAGEPLTPDSPVNLTVEDKAGQQFTTAVLLGTPVRRVAEAFLHDRPGRGAMRAELVAEPAGPVQRRPLNLDASLFDEGISHEATLRIYRAQESNQE